MKTINKLKEVMEVPSDLSGLTNLPMADLFNEKIIASLMIEMQSDIHALQFCDIMESLVDSRSSITDIETLRNGM